MVDFDICPRLANSQLKWWLIQNGGCVFVRHEALGFWHKLCITNVFYLKLISLTCGCGLFASGISEVMQTEERAGG